MRSFASYLQVRVNSDELAMKVDEDVRAFHAEVERSTRGRNNGVIQTQVRYWDWWRCCRRWSLYSVNYCEVWSIRMSGWVGENISMYNRHCKSTAFQISMEFFHRRRKSSWLPLVSEGDENIPWERWNVNLIVNLNSNGEWAILGNMVWISAERNVIYGKLGHVFQQ